MRNRILLAMVVLFALAAFAQQTNNISSSNAAGAPASGSAEARGPLPSQQSTDFWDGDDPNLVNLITHPFANTTYVLRQVTPIRDRVNELQQITSENAPLVKDIGARAQQGVQLSSEKASLADQHAAGGHHGDHHGRGQHAADSGKEDEAAEHARPGEKRLTKLHAT